MNHVSKINQNHVPTRLDQISGWRLILALVFLVLNLSGMVVLTLLPTFLSDSQIHLALAMVTAFTGLFAMAAAATSLPRSVSFSLVLAVLLWNLWLADHLWGADLSPTQGINTLWVVPYALFSYVGISLTNGKPEIRFAIVDVLVLSAGIGISLAILRNLAPEWQRLVRPGFGATPEVYCMIFVGFIRAIGMAALIQFFYGTSVTKPRLTRLQFLAIGILAEFLAVLVSDSLFQISKVEFLLVQALFFGATLAPLFVIFNLGVALPAKPATLVDLQVDSKTRRS